jgi:hypothetical protein
MTKIYLLDPRSEIFQSFLTAEQLFQFANRQTRNFNGRTLIVRNGTVSRCVDLGNEKPKEIYDLAVNLQTQIR